MGLTSASPKPHIGTISYPECVVTCAHIPDLSQALPSLFGTTNTCALLLRFPEAKATCPYLYLRLEQDPVSGMAT